MAVTLNYVPHAAQREIHEARGFRFRTVCTGRRFGKTLCLAAELLDRGGCDPLTPQERGSGAGRLVRDYGWIAPTYNVAERGIEAFKEIAFGFIRIVGRMPTRIEFEGAAGPVRVWFLSADNPDNIRGYGFQGLVVDEAAMIPADVWHYVLRPTIAQTLGWAVFVSTPKGRNWFYDMHTRGLDAAEPDYASLSFPSKASPFFPASEWEDAKRTLPEDVFRQEYEAQFLEDSAGVFRGVEGCLIQTEDRRMKTEDGEGRPQTADRSRQTADGMWPGRRSVVIGCDVAKHTDFTVLVAMDAVTGRCFAMERFNQLDWPIQKERIEAFVRRHRGRLIMDASGVGDPVYDELKQRIADVEAFKFTAASKVALIQRLIVAVEQREVSWPAGGGRDCRPQTADCRPGGETEDGRPKTEDAYNNGDLTTKTRRLEGDWGVLTAEMKRYEYVITANGHISYNAPSGYHDDCVIALALANWGRWEAGNAGVMMRVAGDGKRQGVRGKSGGRVLVG